RAARRRASLTRVHPPLRKAKIMATTSSNTSTRHEPWFKYGVATLFLEMAIAIAVSAYSLYMTFNGLGGFPGKH
ncbi:MAG TPA: hypothetical protein VMU81_06160, partial [Acetobacteraceae bacterium]|nr:hypothetical protein [Acetobacteraceae bacterium]